MPRSGPETRHGGRAEPAGPSKTTKASKASRANTGRKEKGGVTKSGGDALRLTLGYLEQETLTPLRGLVRFVVAGIAGAIALSIGLAVLLLAGLRALQTETGSTFTDHLSWIPYLIVIGAALVVAALAGWRIVSGPARRKLPATKDDGGPEE